MFNSFLYFCKTLCNGKIDTLSYTIDIYVTKKNVSFNRFWLYFIVKTC